MRIKVYIEAQDKTRTVNAKSIREILQKLKVNPTTVIVVKDNEVITEEAKLKENDRIKLLSVISGG